MWIVTVVGSILIWLLFELLVMGLELAWILVSVMGVGYGLVEWM